MTLLAADPSSSPPGLEGAIYAIGNFDGVHRGHRAVVERARVEAAKIAAPTAVLTFEPHPADFFAGQAVVFRLTPPEEKLRQLEALEVDGIATFSFNAALAALTAEEFVADILVRRLGVGGVVVGGDFHFGKERGGSPAFLKEAGGRLGFAVIIIDKVPLPGGEAVSSSKIRRALEVGDVRLAAAGLGRPYAVSGEVISGRRLGRTLGVPTANLALEATNRLAYGVYAVRAETSLGEFDGVASFGVRPTIDNGQPLLEVHLFDFAGDLYGARIRVSFIGRIRDERRFDTLQALKEEMDRDMTRAKELIARTP